MLWARGRDFAYLIAVTDAPAPPHRWTVLAFAGVAQHLKERRFEMDAQDKLSVAAFKSLISTRDQSSEFDALLQGCRVAADHTMLQEQDIIPFEAQELALIPPVSGGIDPIEHQGAKSRLTSSPLQAQRVIDQVMHENAGGIDVFIGNVRRQSRGLQVTHLEYEAYPAMAVKVMDAICTSIESEIPGSRVCIHHRVGRLDIGESAVVIAASAPHRAPAFEACRKAIETLKQDVPIWKKEFDDKGGTWIGQGP